MGDEGTVIKICCGFGAIVVLLVVILVPISFSGLNYYEMGFRKQKSTGTVKLDHVYESGNHFIGPDFEFKVFPADGQFLDLYRIKAFTADSLEVTVSVHMQYFLRSYDLPDLFRKFNLDYEGVMETSAIDALKGAFTEYTTRQIINKRAEIETKVFKTVRERLGGTCCAPQAFCRSWKYACSPGCTERAKCEDSDKGVYADVKFFQLGRINIPHSVEERFLRALVLQEHTQREKLLQDAQVLRKETSSMIQKIKNSAAEKREEAEATSKLIQATSAANYTSEVEGARSVGLFKLYNELGITSQKHKNSFDYLRTLRGLDNIHLTVDYDQRITGNFGSR